MEKEMIYHPLFILVLVVLSFMLLVCLIRAVKGPRVADRLMAVNMMGTMVMVMISVLALLFQESYLVDICLIYAMISFLSVVVISKVYIGIYEEQHHNQEHVEGEIPMSAVDWIRLVIGSLFVLAGIVIFFTELYGVFHFKYVLNRMHAAAMGDTLGISACLIGLMIFSGLNFTTLKMFLVIVFLWFASPVSSHVLSRLEAATNDNLAAHCEIYEDVEVLDRELIAAKADKNSEEKEASAL